MTLRLHAETPRDWDALGREWEALEARAPRAPAFRRWAWVGCLAEERFPQPLLIRAEDTGRGGGTVGLALFNRRGGALHLAETGDAERDSPFVEHNGPLVAEGAPELAEAEILRAAWTLGRARRLVLGGVAPALEAAAGGRAWRRLERAAPFVDLAAARARRGGDWMAALSANARQQIRRSDRALAAAAGGGPAEARAAADEDEVEAFFEEMVALHLPRFPGGGAYGTPWRRRFHRELARRQFRAGQLDLLRVAAGGRLVGVLHNVRAGGATCAYQSGWAPWPEAGSAAKPGLSCHRVAIDRALARGDAEYDLLAGDRRYKRSLAGGDGGGRTLVWAERVGPGLAWGVLRGLRAAAGLALRRKTI